MKLLPLTIGAAAVLVFAAAVEAQPIDVVFKIDESGSMRSEIADIRDNVVTIFNALPPGSAVGLVGYGTPQHFGGRNQIPHLHTPLTTVPSDFQAAVNQLIASGGLEQGYRAVYESATDTIAVDFLGNLNPSLQFTENPYCNILITDERLDQGGATQEQAIDAMIAEDGIFFGILPANLFAEAETLAYITGGRLFDLASFQQDPLPVIKAVLAACVTAATVKIDIKPTSCPNPFKLKQKGVVPVAILGTEDFDVTNIKPETVRLEGDCEALRWNIEDVATPYENSFNDPPFEDECTTLGADGWPDLTVKFDSQCVAMTQGVVTGRETRLWTITGTYVNDNGDDVKFKAKDVVRIMP